MSPLPPPSFAVADRVDPSTALEQKAGTSEPLMLCLRRKRQAKLLKHRRKQSKLPASALGLTENATEELWDSMDLPARRVALVCTL